MQYDPTASNQLQVGKILSHLWSSLIYTYLIYILFHYFVQKNKVSKTVCCFPGGYGQLQRQFDFNQEQVEVRSCAASENQKTLSDIKSPLRTASENTGHSCQAHVLCPEWYDHARGIRWERHISRFWNHFVLNNKMVRWDFYLTIVAFKNPT